MNKLVKYFLLGSIIFTTLTGCKKEDEVPTKPSDAELIQGYKLVESNLKAVVSHPVTGPGPFILIQLYNSEKDFNENRPYRNAVSDTTGQVFFEKIPAGYYILDSRIPGNPGLYAKSTVTIQVADTGFVDLYLR